jgi:MYXO-CTERM domain-containing protein
LRLGLHRVASRHFDKILGNGDTFGARFTPSSLATAAFAVGSPLSEPSGVSMLKITSVIVAASLASVAQAGFVGNSQFYDDIQNDIFDTGFGNLDILSGQVTDDGTNITFTVETRDFANWTKFMLFIDVRAGGTSSNAWNRPVNLTSDIDYFVGSWVDQPSNNAQFVSYVGGGWDWGNVSTLTNSVMTGGSTGGNFISWTMSLASLGLSGGETIYFDIATSGGGNDPGVDHLSRQTLATSGWGSPSTSGTFLEYQVSGVPAPGAIALLGLAGLAGRRRR